MIYVVRDKLSGMVKIGFSDSPWRRFAKMRTDNPGELSMRALFEGDMVAEKVLHQRFDLHRKRGEWFEPVGDLAEWMLSLPIPARPTAARGERLALIDLLAETCGVGPQTARGWLDRDSIPGRFWLALSEAGIFSLEELAHRHAKPATKRGRAA